MQAPSERTASGRGPDEDVVVLVDDAGRPTGTAPRASVHTADTPLHLAFSAHLLDRSGRLLVTRRALGKVAWPGVWTNACCGHLRPGESALESAARRIPEELGATPIDLRLALPGYRYRAVDASGIVEHELCPVLVGYVDPAELDPDAAEVAEWAWVDPEVAVRTAREAPFAFSPWAAEQLQLLDEAGLLDAELLDDAGSIDAAARTAPGGALDGRSTPAPELEEFLARAEARLEAHLDRLDEDWERLARSVPLDVLPADLPSWMRTRVRGGKRFRVRMAHLGFAAVAEATSTDAIDSLADLAAALELLHLFGIVHDDVMDESSSRRGGPSAHVEAAAWHRRCAKVGAGGRFGESLAVLLGDLAHAVADDIASALPPRERSWWRDLSLELIVGQRADLTGAAARRRDVESAALVARLKSSRYTIERPLAFGAAMAGADAAQLAALEAWGEQAGLAFALRDDLLGVWGDPELTGKPVGDDLLEAKPTVIMALGAERLRGADAEALDRLGTARMAAGDVDLVAAALERAGIRAEMEALIEDAVSRADAVLVDAPLRPAGALALRDAIRSVAWRTS